MRMSGLLLKRRQTLSGCVRALAAVTSCVGLLLTGTAYGAGTTTRISVDSSGGQGDKYSRLPVVSADGRYVAFASDASNLVADDTNTTSDIFVRDRSTGVTTRVSVDSSGSQALYAAFSYDPALSADGRFVAFTSLARNLVADDTTSEFDVFVHDRDTGVTSRVSTSTSGVQGNGDSNGATLSADGRYVAFASSASNLVADDTNAASDIFVHDRETGETSRVSVSSSGIQANDDSYGAALSADGRYVAFYSLASTLVAGDSNSRSDVFVHDRESGVTTRVSLDSSGAQANGASTSPALSADGRYVAFSSDASNLVANDNNSRADVFIHDRETVSTTRISVRPDGIEGNGRSYNPTLSADGRYTAFTSDATNLSSGITDGVDNIFIRDNQSGEVIPASVGTDGSQPQGFGYFGSNSASLSADGRTVVFSSYANHLVSDDTNAVEDIFAHEWSPTFSILKSGTGSGFVTSIPSGISCGTSCNAPFEKNTSIALTAQAAAGYEFAGWNGPADCNDGVVAFMDDLMHCTARFVPIVNVAATIKATEAGPLGGRITLARTGSTATTLTVYYTTRGTATSGTDYRSLSGNVTFERFSSTATIYISPINDHLVERDETVTVQLMPSDDYVVGAVSAGTVQIVDIPEVTVIASDPIATEAGLTTGRFIFTRSGSAASALTVNFVPSGTAGAGRDYRSIGTRVTFPVGIRTVTKTITPIDDAEIEPPETVALYLRSSGYYNQGSKKPATVRIMSNEIPVVTVATIDATATEAGRTTGKFMISRTGSLQAPLTVTFKIGGTATRRADYLPLGTRVVFGPGVRTMVGTVVPISDNLREPNEMVTLTLSPNSAYSIAPPGSGTITISDN